MESEEKFNLLFGVYDYVVFAVTLVICASISIYFAVKKSTTADTAADYLFGGRKMSAFPISMSLIASYMTGVTYLGSTTEMYFYGTNFMFFGLGGILAGIASAYVFLPVFYEMGLSSTYEYLEKRFDKKVRLFASIAFTIFILTWLPAMVYVPAIVFNQVTGVSVYIITPCICIISIFYTTVGGLKAVIWTDVLQTFIRIGILLLVFIKGTLDIGGFDLLWKRNQEGGRIETPSFRFDLTDRHSIWSVTIGSAMYMLSVGMLNQNMIQRYMALPTLKEVKRAVCIFVLGSAFVVVVFCIPGLLVYAKYFNCDPLASKLVKAKDQLLPLLVMQVLGDYTGMPGLFVAAVLSTALGCLSTGLSAMSAVVLEDFVKLSFPRKTFSDRSKIMIMKSVAIFFGATCIGLIYVVEKLGGILQFTISINAMANGPTFAIFCGGMLLPWMNAKGAFYGGLLGLGVNSFVVLSAQKAIAVGEIEFLTKPFSVDGCDNSTSIVLTNSTYIESGAFPLFKISYLWYSLFGCAVTLLLAMAISWFTGFNDPKNVNPLYLSPVIRRYLPGPKIPENEGLLTPI